MCLFVYVNIKYISLELHANLDPDIWYSTFYSSILFLFSIDIMHKIHTYNIFLLNLIIQKVKVSKVHYQKKVFYFISTALHSVVLSEGKRQRKGTQHKCGNYPLLE